MREACFEAYRPYRPYRFEEPPEAQTEVEEETESERRGAETEAEEDGRYSVYLLY